MNDFKFKDGDLVYGWDTYRGIIGTIKGRLEKGDHHAHCYSIEIIKKTQPSFYVKRWDNERFWENEITLVKSYSDIECVLQNGRIIPIMSDDEIIKKQSDSYPHWGKLINNFMMFCALLMVTSCAPFMLEKQGQIEDCISNHLKIFARKETSLNENVYEKVVDSCKSIYQFRR